MSLRWSPRFAVVLLATACGAEPTADQAPNDAAAAGSRSAARRQISDQCDGAKIVSLSKTLASADARNRGTLVAEHLPGACQLPPPVTAMLQMTASAEQRDAAAAEAFDHAEALSTVCPGAAVVTKQAAHASADERPGIVFDACKLARFDLVDRATFALHDESAVLAFVAHQWLLDQGLTQAQAEPISRALLLRARPQLGLPGQQLARVTTALGKVPHGVEVHATPTEIRMHGKKLVSLVDGKLDPSAVRGHLVSALYDRLAQETEAAKSKAEATGEEWDQRLVFVADARLPFATVVDIMYTAGQAEFGRYAMVAESGPMAYGAVPVEPPKFRIHGPPSGEDQAPGLGVFLDARGFSITDGVPRDEPERIDGGQAGDEVWNLVAIAARAASHRKAHDTARRATVAAAGTTPWGPVLGTLAALRGAECASAPASCVLPELTLAAEVSMDRGIPLMARNFDPEMAARNAEILGVLSAKDGHFLASPYGDAFAVGGDDEDVWGGLTGSEVGEAYGLGLSGAVGSGGTGEGTIGLGTTGLIGKSGPPSGKGSAGAGKPVPRVRQAKAKVTGALDKDIVRRVVRIHINEVRHCYSQGLVRDDALAGRVEIAFTIAGTGKVGASTVAGTTLADAAVGRCIAKAVKRWKFPKPSDGGNVVVAYPFVLSPG